MDPVQNKKDVFFFLHPGGLNILQAPSLLGWTPVQPMTSSASMVWGLCWRRPRWWRTPPPEGSGCGLPSCSGSCPGPADLPVGCPSPDGLRPPHGLPCVSLKNGLATQPAIFQTSERWVRLLSHFSMTSTWSWLFEVCRISCTVWNVTQRKLEQVSSEPAHIRRVYLYQ